MPTKKPAPLSSATIKPYASYTLFTCDDKSFKTIQDKLTKMESLAQGAFHGKMTVLATSGFWKEIGVLAKAFTLREDRASAWSADKSVIDTIHHLVVLLHYSGYYAIVITDSAARALATIADFDGARSANFGAYDVEVEKPVKLDANGAPTKSIDYAKIGTDNSLCSWWLNVGALDVFSGLRKLGANDFAIMVCDDGAGEVADFILFARHGSFATATNPSTLAVIQVHLKAAGALNKTPTISGAPRLRRMAPKQFEEVLGQAVKNLSVIRMPSLGEDFEKALLAGKNPLWELQGNQFALALPYGTKTAKGSRFLNCIKAFNGQRYHKHVIVVQPHQSLARFNVEMAAQHPTAKMRLLCTLLNSADAACRSDGAKFDTIFSP
jgi:hypothetical protein